MVRRSGMKPEAYFAKIVFLKKVAFKKTILSVVLHPFPRRKCIHISIKITSSESFAETCRLKLEQLLYP